MPELTELISLDNWRKIKPMLPISNTVIPFPNQVDKSVDGEKPADLSAGVVPPPHELQVDPVSPAFEMWHDAEGRN